ncbi:hypothetical protein [Plebeiibacterium marinum]|uniref:Uncharacterized protein n=1 Tax=Plebeiibacterium marinum TaxID=2992111 RepID=A0AAE3SM72_9BACT|nr:hypothetical protein [Plebeiobacterium marinum]MCW3807250.1 hypothetical protein [Plebeiobacterium marinum]
MRIIILSVLTLFFSLTTFSQSSQPLFSDNPEEFIPTIENIFKSIADKKFAKEYTQELSEFWYNPELEGELKLNIIDNCNQMAIKRARPVPDYVTYLSIVREFINSEISESNFNAWNSAITDLIKKKRYPLRKVNQLLEITSDLLKNNVVYSTPSTKWASNNNHWQLRYDKDLIGVFPALDLTCFSKNDSIKIFETSGSFNYTTNIWKGDKGKVTWERSGYSADSLYATFNQYTFPFKDAGFEIDTVKFYNYIYFDKPLNGRLKHKVMNINTPEASTYPQFLSREERFDLTNIHPNINYEGGFAQNGAKFLGAGTYEDPATITIFRNDTLFITAKSLYFALRKDQILSTDTEVKIQLDTGFIYHPGLTFKLMADLNELHLIRDGEGLAISPYFNTFHNVSMDIELLSWNLDKNIIDLKMVSGAAENHGAFESLSYFRENFYNQLQGMDAIHPLQGLKNCSRMHKGKPFTAYDYAQMIGLPEAQVRQQVIQLSFFGFIGYNVNTDEIQIRQRLKDYLDFRLGKKDFDVIRFASNTPGRVNNAHIDLLNFDLNINGVKSISISDNQNVVFFPRDEKILLKRNRNFIFDGVINAGMLNLYGEGFKFNYDNFLIDMRNIDSLRMQVQTGELDYFGHAKLTYVQNAIEKLSGTLEIDKPDNKSGRNYYSQYPILHSSSESYVYYDKPEIQNGLYDREKFYFRLDTFSMDSISKLSRKNFDFEGTFVSNIFPTFKENLTVQTDYSLGFNRATPEQGYDIYDHRATYIADIDLSNKGLRGNGTLKYITSTSKSENFLFLPEETNGQAYDFIVDKQEEGVEYPDVTGKFNHIAYYPYQDKLESTSQEQSFTMFNDEAQLEGKIVIGKGGATGKGTFYMDKANIVSPDMTFGGHTLLADSSDFNLVSGDMGDVSFNTTNLISNIDFETRKGKFISKSGGSLVNFTDNRYISYISEFSWDMDLNNIYMGASGSEGNRFVSTHRKQDSLDFKAPLARYDVEKKIIFAEEVKNINVADADIQLNDGFITIYENAEMAPIDSATILLEDSTFAHTIYNSHLNIDGKYDYSGYGEYDYINGNGKKFTIQMNDIKLTEEKRTTATGTIVETDLFTFDKNFTFKGKSTLNANQQNLYFDGGVQMLHHCNGGPQTFMYFNSVIDPSNIMFPIGDEPKNYERDNIYRDFFITKDSAHIYSSFLQSRKDYSDIPVISASGYLHFNDKENAFEIAPLHKINNPDSTGVVFKYSNSRCDVLAEGPLEYGIDLGQFKYKNVGTIIDNPKKDRITITNAMGIDFFFDEAITNMMVTAILASGATESKISDETLQKRFAEWIGPSEAKKLLAKKNTVKQIENLTPEINNMFTFGNIDLSFDGAAHAYVSDGKADLTFVKNYVINKKVHVTAEIVKKRSGNYIDMIILFDKGTWFYFSHRGEMMQTLSSDPTYNEAVKTLDEDKRKLKGGIGEKSFTYILAPASKLNRFSKNYGYSAIKSSVGAGGQELIKKEKEEENDANAEHPQQ